MAFNNILSIFAAIRYAVTPFTIVPTYNCSSFKLYASMNHLSRTDLPRDKLLKKFSAASKNISRIDESLRSGTIFSSYIYTYICSF